jgi:hypothetical protein
MICVLCQRREAERAQACDPCRLWLPTVLRDIGDGYPTLNGHETVPATMDPRPGWADPIAEGLPAGTVKNGTRGAPVTGSREAPVPVTLDLVDLTAPARQGSMLPAANGELHQHAAIVARTRSLERHEYAARWDDQVGLLSVATELEFWVIDWIGSRDKGEHRPEPTVTVMIGWLGDRLDDACDQHPAIDEFAADARRMRSTVRRFALGRPELPELCDGVVCSGCDMRNTLYRHPGSQWRAECGACGNLYTDEEYERWTGLLASWTKGAA